MDLGRAGRGGKRGRGGKSGVAGWKERGWEGEREGREGFSPEFGHSSLSGFQQGCGPQVSVCQKSKYRSLDGTCNNPYKPTWGAANTPYARVKPAKYADGVQDPPVSHSGKPLPGARLVSAVLFPDSDIPDPKWTLIAMQWGQIITHDLSQAAGTTQAIKRPFFTTFSLVTPYHN
uniref:Peroxidase n=2 Tax=Timema TaxID=61471 RepID=A0A7R9EGC2_9NEOP|nr:unnamed protein product [Timema monikensis]